MDRLVEAKLMAQRFNLFRRGIVTGDKRHGIGWNDVADHESDHHEPEKSWEEPEKAIQYEDEKLHVSFSLPRSRQARHGEAQERIVRGSIVRRNNNYEASDLTASANMEPQIALLFGSDLNVTGQTRPKSREVDRNLTI